MTYTQYLEKENRLTPFKEAAGRVKFWEVELNMLENHFENCKKNPKDSYTWYNTIVSHAVYLKMFRLAIRESQDRLQDALEEFKNIK